MTTGTDSPLRVKGLKAGYGEQTVLENVDLEVARGEIRVVLGASGCGKSTLLRNVAGLERPRAGTVTLLGHELDWSQGLPDDDIFEKIGVLFQGGALISSLTVGENVALPLRIHQRALPEREVLERVRAKLDQVGLGGTEDKLPGELSGGMRKRAGLARALAADPELLFCDEPSAGLDPVTSRELDDLLLELRETLGITMVVVSHELASIHALADKVTFLSGGKVIFDGALAEGESNGPQEMRDFLERRSSGEGKAGHRKESFSAFQTSTREH